MFSVMLFIFFCFFGILAMFIFVQYRQEQIARALKEENTQLRVLLRAMESRIDYLAQVCLEDDKGAPESAREESGNDMLDPLLRLSFEDPVKTIGNDPDSGLDINLP